MAGRPEQERHQGAGDTAAKPCFRSGQFVPAYPYVEPFLKGEDNPWRREMLYLVAGLWAAHWQEGERGQPMSIGKACAAYKGQMTPRTLSAASSACSMQTATSCHTACARWLLSSKSKPSTSTPLLTGLLYWNDDQKRTQNAWARDFYRNMNNEMETEPVTQEEIK